MYERRQILIYTTTKCKRDQKVKYRIVKIQ